MGSPCRCRRACFHARARPVRLDRPPDVSTRLHSTCCAASSELLRAHHRSSLSGGASCQGLVPLRDITRASPPVAEAPRAPLRSVHRRSQPLDGLLLARAPRLVSSSSHVQGNVCRSGASLSAQGGALVERRCPLAVGTPEARPNLAVRRPRPEASTSRLFSTRRRVLAGSVLSLTGGRSPHRVRLLQVPCAPDRAATSSRPTARGVVGHRPSLAREAVTFPPSACLLRMAGHLCLQRCRPAREFLA